MLSSLQRLDLSYNNITDAGVQSLSVLSNLQQLNLGGCSNITDAGVQVLSRALGPQLRLITDDSDDY